MDSNSQAPERVLPAYGGGDKRMRVERMFDRIATRYDVMNRLMSFGLDAGWRRALVRTARALVPPHGGASALDVATGTGDVAWALWRAGYRVTGIDIAEGMLEVARNKRAPAAPSARGPRAVGDGAAHGAQPTAPAAPTFARADALALPFPDRSFDLVTVAFGVRNFADLDQGLRELVRVTRPGGAVLVLELTTPSAPVVSTIHRAFTHAVLPRLGATVTAEPEAYRYLPASVAALGTATQLAHRFAAATAGDVAENVAVNVAVRPLALGAVALVSARRGAR